MRTRARGQRRSHYPAARAEKDAEGRMRGRPGTVELLQAKVLASQPFVAFDWHPDKEGVGVAACLDQTFRVFIVTRLDR